MTSLPHEKQRKEVKEMNTLVIVLIAAVCLFGAYTLYGRWLANKWGIDPTAKTPAVVHEDGRDYVPTNGWTVFAHQFSSIAGAGPVTGAIQAAAFGWLPVLLWVLLGGIFFGAVTDFGALYASVKNDGKSMGMLIEKYIGKTGRKLFLLFCWLFCGIVIAAFADIGGVVATGGGALLSEENGKVAKRSGMVVFIDTYFNTCYGRIKNDPNRPIAYNSNSAQLSERFDYRRPLYLAHSHYVISGGYPPIVIASKIQKLYKRFDFGQG